jgi:ATP-dependent Zn protease
MAVIDTEALALMDSAFYYAKTWLSDNRETMNTIINQLVETKTMYAYEIYDLMV